MPRADVTAPRTHREDDETVPRKTHARPRHRSPSATILPALLSLPLLLASALPSRAQDRQERSELPVDTTATLTGTVVSAMTGGRLANARVVLVKSGFGAFTDSTGAFRIPRVPAGLDTVEVSLLGYASARAPLLLQKGATTTATFSLSQTVLRVEELHVEVKRAAGMGKLAQFDEHRVHGLGFYITPKMIEQRHAQHPSDLLRMVPGLEVGPYNLGHANVRVVRATLNCNPPIYVDGILSPSLSIDDLNRDDIMAIEVYRGPSETPAEYEQGRNNCGAVVVWTHEGGTQNGH
jgi:hypothetical protein